MLSSKENMSKTKNEQRIEIPDEIIKELLTESEIKMVKQRLYIIKLLAKGYSIRKVARDAGVGTDTVVRISQKFKKSDILKNLYSVKELGSKWIFGEVGSEKDIE